LPERAPRKSLAERLFHTVVISSVLALESTGCTMSHDPIAPTPDAGDDPDAGHLPDAGPRRFDAGAPDAGARDAGAPDAGAPDAGAPDAGVSDAGMIEDIPFCEPGWPTTKAMHCTWEGDVAICCSTLFPLDAGLDERCCVGEEP